MSVLWAFLSLLLSTPSAMLNPQSVGQLWARAQDAPSVATLVTPSPVAWAPSPTPAPWVYQTANPATSPTAVPTATLSTAPPLDQPGDRDAPWSYPSPGPTSTPVYAAAPVETPVPLADVSKYTKNAWGIDTSALFQGNTPFHHTVSELVAAGATVRPHYVAENWWAGGHGSEKPWDETPVYVGLAGQATHTVSCPMYGQCNATGLSIHLPAGARPQMHNTDHHIAVIDLALQQEVDLWLCPLSGGTNCASGGAYPLTGPHATGLVVSRGALNSSGDAGGFAFGVMQITAGTVFTASQKGTSLPYALGMGVNCVDNTGPHYPSSHPADYYCGNLGRYGPNVPTPNVVYGDLLVLAYGQNYSPPPGASSYCAVILRTLHDRGSYVYDVSPGWGSSLHAENPQTYMAGSNPWDTIAAAMVAAGEGYGSGTSFAFSCEKRWTSAKDWSVLTLNQGGDSALPPLKVAAR